MGSSKPSTTTTQTMSPEVTAAMQDIMRRGSALMERPPQSRDQENIQAQQLRHYQSADYNQPYIDMLNQGLRLQSRGVAQNPFTSGVRMLPQDRAIQGEYRMGPGGQRADFSEVRGGVAPGVTGQGAPYQVGGNSPPVSPKMLQMMQSKMGQQGSTQGFSDVANAAQGAASQGGGMKPGVPLFGAPQSMQAQPQQMTDAEFEDYMKRNTAMRGYSGG